MTIFPIPITMLYVALLALLNLVIAVYVARRRLSTQINMGDGGNMSMIQAMRVHANFSEYVPLALMLILVLELSSASALLLHLMGAALFVARIAHAQGLNSSPDLSAGRGIGTGLTFLVYIVGAGTCLYYVLT